MVTCPPWRDRIDGASSMRAKLRELSVRGRVIYKRNPLVEVIAAIKFPPVLRLVQEPPMAFQKHFAKEYPLAQFTQAIQIQIGPTTDDSPAASPRNMPMTYKFETLDKNWMVSVESNLLALTCRKYEQWSDFRGRFDALVRAFTSLYEVTAIHRIGLRYQDVIRKAEFGLEGVPWAELVRPEVLSTWQFFTNGLDENPATEFRVELDIPPGQVRIGISTVTRHADVTGLLIDTDCYSNETVSADPSALLTKADDLHEYTSRVFQACITDKLHAALQKD